MAEIAIPILGLGAMYILSNQNKEEEILLKKNSQIDLDPKKKIANGKC